MDTSPGWIIAKHIIDRGLTIDEVAKLTGCPGDHIEGVITGRETMDARLAARLRDVFGAQSLAWIEIDAAFRLDSVVRKESSDGEP
jgi:plasmid maintenance system antidote protein VapI